MKRKYRFLISLISVVLILLILAVIFNKNVKIDKEYTSKEDVALYLMKYHELPINYYAESKSDSRTYDGVRGGYIHDVDEKLAEFKISSKDRLRECDIAGEDYDDDRGAERLVYTSNTKKFRVFYTSDHYKSYKELTPFKLQLTRNILLIVCGFYILCSIGHVIYVYKVLKKKEKKVE